jgi:hypothetical protein
MKNTIGLTILGILISIPLSLLAENSITSEIESLLNFQDSPRYVLPTVPTTTMDGIDYKCLSVKEWKEVLQISNSFHGLYDWRLQVHSILLAQRDIVMAYELKISSYEQSMATHEANRDYLSTRLDNEKTWNLKLNRSKGFEILAWKIVAGLELAAIVAMSVAVVTKKE